MKVKQYEQIKQYISEIDDLLSDECKLSGIDLEQAAKTLDAKIRSSITSYAPIIPYSWGNGVHAQSYVLTRNMNAIAPQVIKSNLDVMKACLQGILEDSLTGNNTLRKVFISHSHADHLYAAEIINLLRFIGIGKDRIFCTSEPGCWVRLNEDIKQQMDINLKSPHVYVIILHSENYYSSPVCLNEMGAAWILDCPCTSILLPLFSYGKMCGVINDESIAIKLDEYDTVSSRLNELKDKLVSHFGLSKLDETVWETDRDRFIKAIKDISIAEGRQLDNADVPTEKKEISTEAEEILLNAGEDEILFVTTLSGTSIQTKGKTYSSSMGRREFSRWEAALNELLRLKYVQELGKKHEIFQVTHEGFLYIENKKRS